MKILITSRMFGKPDSEPMDLLVNEGFEIAKHPLHTVNSEVFASAYLG